LERTLFFKEINRVLKHGGEAIIVEHLRDLPNFLAYNLGFFHFLTKKLWLKSFVAAQFKIKEKVNITPFLTIYKLHHGIAP
jgi:SAM-dependent methyltransferase